jgi:Flp pilus assembly pilin Flp
LGGRHDFSFIPHHSGKVAGRCTNALGRLTICYALILALIAVVAILVLQGLGGKVNNTLSSVNANLP